MDGTYSSQKRLNLERGTGAKMLAFCRDESHGTRQLAGKLTTNTLACHHTREKKELSGSNGQNENIKMTKSLHPFMQEDSQLRYKKNGTPQSILFAACIKQKRSIYTKPMPTFTCQFLSFHWKQSKKHSYFWEKWVGDITLYIFFLKQFLHLHYHPQPHLNLPLLQIMDSYGRSM